MMVALMASSMAAVTAASLVESKAGSWAVHSVDYLAGLLAVWMAELLGYQLVWLSAVKKAGVRALTMAGPTAGQRVGSKAAPRADLSAGVMAVSSVVAMGEMKVESTV